MIILISRVGAAYPLFSVGLLLLVFLAVEVVANVNNAVEKHNRDNGNEKSV